MIVRKAVVNNLIDSLKLVKSTGCTASACEHIAKKGLFNTIVIENIDNRSANILKQEAISVGSDVAVSENVCRFKKGSSDAVLFATTNQIERLAKKLSLQPFGLQTLSLKLDSVISKEKNFKCRQKLLDLSNPVIMGIVNIDPNSFSGDGLTDPRKACNQAVEFETLGAGIIDVGAESSRPGVKPIDAKTEIKRLLPSLKKIRKSVNIPISVDTYKYETAKAALSEGADIVNDIFALRKGKEKLAKLIADTKAGVILMHIKGIPENMQVAPEYRNCTSEIYEFLSERKEYAMSFGIEEERIAVDSGAGFGKTVKHNVELIKNVSVFSTLGVVVGAVSRKGFVRDLAGDDKTAFTVANFLTVFCGADIIRVHDVKETANVLNIIKTFRKV